MNYLKNSVSAAVLAISSLGLSFPVVAADYNIDTKGAHAFINFKIQHLGYSWLHGRFDDFNGTFSFDKEKPASSTINVTIKTSSINSNHAERDKHLRSKDFLDTRNYPEAQFTSTRIEPLSGDHAKVYGTLTLKGIKKEIVMEVHKVGEGKDPWGGYRSGFSGTTSLALEDFGIKPLGPASTHVEMQLEIEGIRQ